MRKPLMILILFVSFASCKSTKVSNKRINDLSGKKEHSEIEADLEKELGEWRRRQGDPILKTN